MRITIGHKRNVTQAFADVKQVEHNAYRDQVIEEVAQKIEREFYAPKVIAELIRSMKSKP